MNKKQTKQQLPKTYRTSMALLDIEFLEMEEGVSMEELLSEEFMDHYKCSSRYDLPVYVVEEETQDHDPRKDVVGFIFNGEFYARQTT